MGPAQAACGELAADATETVETEVLDVGWPAAPHRVLRSCVIAAQRGTDEAVGARTVGSRMVPIPRFATSPPVRATSGDIAAMALYAGHGVGAVRDVRPAGQLVRELAEGAQRLLGQRLG
jgi:hypothetical protein